MSAPKDSLLVGRNTLLTTHVFVALEWEQLQRTRHSDSTKLKSLPSPCAQAGVHRTLSKGKDKGGAGVSRGARTGGTFSKGSSLTHGPAAGQDSQKRSVGQELRGAERGGPR